MILGIGNDLCDIRRIEKTLETHGDRFKMRCFTSAERTKASRREDVGTHGHVYAKRFAAKEACAKALGTGFTDDIYMKDIGVSEDERGRPFLELRGGALSRLQEMTPDGMKPYLYLSLSDEPPYAQAFVVIEALPNA